MTDQELGFSPIKEYYSGKSILLTGVTGLVGKVLLYKVLKSIDTVNKVYVIIREKKNKNVSERLKELFEKSKGLFDDIDANCLGKVVSVNASLTTVGMNLSESDRNAIINNVSIVFHSAADVTFDTKLKEQVLINVGGTHEIIELCRQLKHFDALVYVSTAYSSPLEMVVSETVYKSNTKPLEILEIARNSTFAMKSSDYLGKYPNTYSFTKNLAENLIIEEFEKEHNLPVTIVRPGIVLNSIREPKCGWFDSITSIMGIILLLGNGLVKIFPFNGEITLDAIPVDMVANTCIASAHQLYFKNKRKVRVYNCNSSCLGGMTYKQVIGIGMKIVKQYPFLYTLRPAEPIFIEYNTFLFGFIQFILETCFACFIDLLLLLIGRKRIALRKLQLYHRMASLSIPYVGRQWYFTNKNMIRLSQQLSDTDCKTFDCDIQSIDWISYGTKSVFETRKLLLREKEEDIERAQHYIKYVRTFYTILNHLVLYVIWYVLITMTPISVLINTTIGAIVSFDALNFGFYLLLISAAFKSVVNFI